MGRASRRPRCHHWVSSVEQSPGPLCLWEKAPPSSSPAGFAGEQGQDTAVPASAVYQPHRIPPPKPPRNKDGHQLANQGGKRGAIPLGPQVLLTPASEALWPQTLSCAFFPHVLVPGVTPARRSRRAGQDCLLEVWIRTNICPGAAPQHGQPTGSTPEPTNTARDPSCPLSSTHFQRIHTHSQGPSPARPQRTPRLRN